MLIMKNGLMCLETMAGWDVKMVIPGHGDPGGLLIIFESQRAYLKDLFEQVTAGIKASQIKRSADQRN